jgi:Ala-tRNA(Pro) deacylase
MTMLKRCLDYMKDNGIRHVHSIHAPAYTARELAAAEEMSPRAIAKTVVYRGDNGYGILAVPADCSADLDTAGGLLGLTFIRLATEAELALLFPDSELGAMPPLGKLFGMPVLVDANLAEQDYIEFNAGTHRDVIRMSFADFRRFMNPLIASFAIAESPAARRTA